MVLLINMEAMQIRILEMPSLLFGKFLIEIHTLIKILDNLMHIKQDTTEHEQIWL